jgi:hypothetical protein
MPDIEHDWGFLWGHPHLILLGHVEGLDSSREECSFVLHNNLVLLLLGDFSPVLLHGLHLVGFSEGRNFASEGDNLWDLVCSIVLHLSDLVVLLVESIPLFVVNVNDGSFVWLLTDELHVFSGMSLEFHVEHLELVELSLVLLGESLDLRGWAILLQDFDVLGDSYELIGVDKSFDLSLELLAMVRSLHLSLVSHGLVLKSLTVFLKTLNLLLLEFDGEHLSSFSEMVDGTGGGDGSDSERAAMSTGGGQQRRRRQQQTQPPLLLKHPPIVSGRLPARVQWQDRPAKCHK